MLITNYSAVLLVCLLLSSFSAGRQRTEDSRLEDNDPEYRREDLDEDDQPDDDDTDFEEAGPGADDFEEFDREQGDEEPAETFRPKFDPEHLGSEEHPFGRKEWLPHGNGEPHQWSQKIHPNKNIDDVCLTPECVVAAAHLIEKMNIKINPCDDFYEYACGRFPDVQEKYNDMPRVMSFELLRRKNKYALKRIFSKLDKNQESKAITNVIALYDSCMNTTHMNEIGNGPILKEINKYGPWPLDDEGWNAETWNFKKALNKVTVDSPTFALFSLVIGLDSKDAEHYIFQISQSGLSLPKEYFLSTKPHETKAVDAYAKMRINVVKLLGYKKNVEASMKKVLAFEKELAKIFISSTRFRAEVNKLYKKTNFRYLAEEYPEIDWISLLNDFVKIANRTANDRQPVVIQGEEYLKRLVKLIKKTDNETLANYLFWRIASPLAHFGPENLRNEFFNFHKVYYGTTAKSPRWKTCMAIAEGWMKFALGKVYVDHKFNSKAKRIVHEMIEDVREQFIKNLKHVKWMDDKTKEKAKEKAEAVLPLVAYPSYILSNAKLDKHYEGIELTNKDYLGNYLQLNKHDIKKSIEKLFKGKRDRHEWTSAPSVVNAFYSQIYNRIVFPAGILQPPFYSQDYPLSLNFGGMGTVSGHELTHGFDDLGRKYDKNGNMHHWWSDKSIKEFEKRAGCIRKQYSSFQIYGRHIRSFNRTNGTVEIICKG